MRSCTDASLRSRERTSGKNLGYLEHTRSTGGSQRRVHTVHGPRKRGGSRYRVGAHGKVFFSINRVAATRLRRHTPAPAPPLSLLPPQSLVYEPPHATSRTARQVSAARRAAKALSHTAQTAKLLKEVVDTDDSWKGLYMDYLEKRRRKEVRQLLTNLIADKEAPILGKHHTLKQWLDELDDGKCQHEEIRAKVTQLFPVGKGAERVAKAQRCAEQGTSRFARRCR
eukprot:scaffold42321_cov71-Phaeocystis_antarctica.AAC.1